MEGVRIYEDAELDAALSKSNTPNSPDAIKKVIIPAVHHPSRFSCEPQKSVDTVAADEAYRNITTFDL
jgi:hypothetical protein